MTICAQPALYLNRYILQTSAKNAQHVAQEADSEAKQITPSSFKTYDANLTFNFNSSFPSERISLQKSVTERQFSMFDLEQKAFGSFHC